MRPVLVVVSVMVCLSGSAAADEADYRPENEGWNGLSDFFDLARAAGAHPDMRAEIPWDTIGPNDAVAILYPLVVPDAARLHAFVAAGGRLLVADDFGQAAAALAPFGLARTVPHAQRHYGDRTALPIATPAAREHRLSAGVGEVVTNHASAWKNAGGGQAILEFAPGEALAIELSAGRGTLVALSDPSILINDMLAFEGNRAFAQNLVGTLVRPGGRLVVVTQEFAEHGEPSAALLGKGASASSSLAAFNDFLVHLGAFVPTDTLLRGLGGVGALTGGALLLFGLRSTRRRADAFARPFALASARPSRLALAALLREDVDARLARALALEEPPSSLPLAELEAKAHAQGGPRAARRLSVLYPKLHRERPPLRLRSLAREADRLMSELEGDRA